MPHDWLFEVERIIISLVPAYTLEMLDNSDIERILPYYFFDYRKAMRAKKKSEKGADNIADDSKTVMVNGKRYRRITADSLVDKQYF